MCRVSMWHWLSGVRETVRTPFQVRSVRQAAIEGRVDWLVRGVPPVSRHPDRVVSFVIPPADSALRVEVEVRGSE
jgi:hypothetical protein